MNRISKSIVAFTLAIVGVFGLAACTSDAAKISDNLSTAADQFEVQRSIVGINGITDKVVFLVEGRCSIEDESRRLVVTCKHGPKDFRKHYIGLSDNTFYVITQMDGVDASVYHTRVILKPENILPQFDIEMGKDF